MEQVPINSTWTVDWNDHNFIRRINRYRNQVVYRARHRLGIDERSGPTVVPFTREETDWLADQYRADPGANRLTVTAAFNSHFGANRSDASIYSHVTRNQRIRDGRNEGRQREAEEGIEQEE